jgi:hypothetical protein
VYLLTTSPNIVQRCTSSYSTALRVLQFAILVTTIGIASKSQLESKEPAGAVGLPKCYCHVRTSLKNITHSPWFVSIDILIFCSNNVTHAGAISSPKLPI